MNTGVFVLIMIFGGSSSQTGMAVLNQEFSSFEKCEIARKAFVKAAIDDPDHRLRSHACVAK